MFTLKIKQSVKLLSLLVLVFAVSCKDEEPVPTSLQVQVLDPDGQPQSEVTVALFKSEADLLASVDSIAQKTTDINGMISFTSVTAQEYFLNAQKASATNWDTDFSTGILKANQANALKVTITSSLQNYLTGISSKAWQLKDVKIENTTIFEEVDACEKDNTIVFSRAQNAGVEHKGESLCAEDKGPEDFKWSFLNEEKDLVIEYTNNNRESILSIIELSNTTLRADVAIDFDGQPIPAEFIYEHTE